MKPIYFRIPKTTSTSIRVQVDRQPYLYDTYHFHPEMQLMVILEGEGTRFVGETMDSFAPGDVYLLGANLPHMFRCAPTYYLADSGKMAHSVQVYFKPETFGEGFLHLPEAGAVLEVLQAAAGGLAVHGPPRNQVADLLREMPQQADFVQVLRLFEALHHIAHAKDLRPLSHLPVRQAPREADSKRINAVFNLVLTHYQRLITLEEAAGVANMTTNAFCRFFKQRTRKTFSRFLNEVRIGYAARMLTTSDRPIADIAFSCGFNNLSSFNRQFKAIKELTPSNFRKQSRRLQS
ncbi:MAG: AraC family transcriptional regulator [Bacteroidota bacterium]